MLFIIPTIIAIFINIQEHVSVVGHVKDGEPGLPKIEPIQSCSKGSIIENKASCLRDLEQNQEGLQESAKSSAEQEQTQFAMALVLYDESVISPFHINKRTFNFGDLQIEILQDWENAGVAAVVWEAAVVLGEYLEKNRHLLEKGPVLELGAGTGLTGIVAAGAGGDVTITDRQIALDIIKKNVDLNRGKYPPQKLKIQELDWGKDLDKYTTYSLVIGADIIYIEETFQDLLKTVLHVCDAQTLVLISCKIRYSRDNRFLSIMEEHFTVTEIYYEQERDIHIYQCIKR